MAQSPHATRRKYHFIYKTTCLITGKYYIGMHSTDNLQDGYKGSGKHLRHSIRKHGEENHVVEILEFVDDRKALLIREEQIVTKEIVDDKLCMNIRLGGTGGWEHLTKEHRILAGQKATESIREKRKNPDWIKQKYDAQSKATKLSYQNGSRDRSKCKWPETARLLVHSPEANAKRKKTFAAQQHQQGERNSRFGCKLMHFNNQIKSVAPDQISAYEKLGWSLGLKPKIKKRSRQEYVNEVKNELNEKAKEILIRLKSSSIDFQKWGWMKKAAAIIGIRRETVSDWLKKYDLEFFFSCLQRTPNTTSKLSSML